MNQYPVYSLTQALDRLSPRTRAKYDSLKGLLADAEALQRSLMERIKVKEDRLADLGRRRSYSSIPGGDAAEVERLDVELAAIRADLDKLERERSRRNSVRADVEQTCSRLDNHIMQFFSGASDLEPPLWPDTVPGPSEGESLSDALLRMRHEISIVRGERTRVAAAPPPAHEVKAAITAEVDRMAGGGVPRVAIAAGRVVVHWPDVQLHSAPGQALSAPSGSASALLCALFPAEIKKMLTAGITDVQGAVSSVDRPRLIREAEARIFALEIAEERLVMAAIAAGLEVHRRIDASPWAILYTAAEEEAHAEAAE